jgi:hypothetical protein
MNARIALATSPAGNWVWRNTAAGMSFIGPPMAANAAAAISAPNPSEAAGAKQAIPEPTMSEPVKIMRPGWGGTTRLPTTRVAAKLVQP